MTTSYAKYKNFSNDTIKRSLQTNLVINKIKFETLIGACNKILDEQAPRKK